MSIIERGIEMAEKKASGLQTYMNVNETIQFMEVCFKNSIVPCLLGHTGVGKTEVVRKMAADTGRKLTILYVSQLEPSDFIGLYKFKEDKNGEDITVNCRPSWLPAADEKEPGIIFLDEVNRGHEDMRQALFQFITNKRIHTYQLPDNWHIVTAANPFDSYEVQDFDKALRNRFAWVKFKPDVDETIDYLGGKYDRNAVLGWARTNKTSIEYGDDFPVDDVIFSPRMLEKSMQVYNDCKQYPDKFIRKAMSTLMSPENVSSFLAYLEEIKHFTAEDVLKGKKQEKVKALVTDKRMDVLSSVTLDLADYFRKAAEEKTKLNDKEVDCVTDYLMEVPEELCMTFIDALKGTYEAPNSITNHATFRPKLKKRLEHLKTVLREG